MVLRLGRDALWTVLVVGAPMLGLAMVTGLVISVLQATTQINEQTLTFVPKILVVLAAGLRKPRGAAEEDSESRSLPKP